MGPVFGKLEKVDPSEVWEHVSEHFKPWLAEDSSITQIGEVVGLEVEKDPDQIQSDNGVIKCRDKNSGNPVLIDSRLKAEGDSSIGQMLLSATGSKAATVVWIEPKIDDETRESIAWFNEITRDRFKFFGVQFELWRIGESNFAPSFALDCGPGKKETMPGIPAETLDDEQKLMLEYWSQFLGVLKEAGAPFADTKPQPQHSMSFPGGREGCMFVTFADHGGKRVGVYLQLSGEKSKANLKELHEKKSEIESAIGSQLEWRELSDQNEAYIMLRWEGVDPTDEGKWREQHEWLCENFHEYHRVLSPIIRDLNTDKTLYHELPWE